jgi:hypothetical protein
MIVGLQRFIDAVASWRTSTDVDGKSASFIDGYAALPKGGVDIDAVGERES